MKGLLSETAFESPSIVSLAHSKDMGLAATEAFHANMLISASTLEISKPLDPFLRMFKELLILGGSPSCCPVFSGVAREVGATATNELQNSIIPQPVVTNYDLIQ